MTAAFRLAAPDLIDRHDLTVDDVAHLPDDLHYELIDGRLVLTPAALPIHQNIGYYVMAALKVNCPVSRYVSYDQSVTIDGHNERRPDVVVVRVPGANRTPLHPHDVLLAVEIVSPSSKVFDRDRKMKDYAYAKIPAYWIIDPLAERVTLTRFALQPGGDYGYVAQTDELVTVDQPWTATFDVPAWTRERDWLREAGRPDR